MLEEKKRINDLFMIVTVSLNGKLQDYVLYKGIRLEYSYVKITCYEKMNQSFEICFTNSVQKKLDLPKKIYCSTSL